MAKQAIFEKKNVVVTGGAGFIGSHLCDDLIKDSKVICIDNFVSGDERNIDHLLQHPDFEFIRHDINEPLDLESLPELEKFRVAFQGVQEIYHLACPTSPKNFEKTIVQTALANSVGMRNVLDMAVKYGAKFLFASSSVVYGPRNNATPQCAEEVIGEIDALGPRACYDEGKRFAETMTVTYRNAYQLDTKIARIFRTYGSRMKLNDGQMLPDFVYSAIEGTDLVIYGDENFTSAFCHVSDIVQGLIKLMKSGESGPMNFGSDREYALKDVAELVIDMVGSSSNIVYQPPLLFMTPLCLPNIARAKEQLGWFPVMLLEDGIQEAIQYFKASKTVIKPGTTEV